MTRTADDILEHHGVKGMKWGVRNDKGHEGERVKTRKLKRLDKNWEKQNSGMNGWIKIHNMAAEQMNSHVIHEINSKPEYDAAAKAGHLLDMNHPVTQKYHKEMETAFNKAFADAAVSLGSNPSGTKKYVLEIDPNDGQPQARLVPSNELKHAAAVPDPTYRVPMDKQGRLLSIVQEDVKHEDTVSDFLAHHGVKGMKWGVRRDKNPVAVETKTAPGRKVKASGGQHHSPSEDAIKAAKIRQQAKKSTTDSLSNKELQDLITRMNLENQYANMNKNNVGVGKKLLRVILGQTGDKEVSQLQEFANTKRGTENDPRTNFAVKVAVAGAKTATGANGGGKKK